MAFRLADDFFSTVPYCCRPINDINDVLFSELNHLFESEGLVMPDGMGHLLHVGSRKQAYRVIYFALCVSDHFDVVLHTKSKDNLQQ